jgi:D-alanyl-D-alanine carboxypeptidase
MNPMRSLWMFILAAGALAAVCAMAATAPDKDFGQSAAALLAREVPAGAPGVSVLVARGDTVVYRAARGLASVELGVPLKSAQIFRIGSITKTFTAAAILKLSSQGQLSLQDPLSRFLPDFPDAARITLDELLDHTAGISDDWDIDTAKAADTAALLPAIAGHAPDFPPGEGWRYSNSGYLLLGAVLEKVTGRRWDRALADLVITPAGLKHTAFHPDEEAVPLLAAGYSLDAQGAVIRPPYVNITGPGAAGALESDTLDLFHWMRALATQRVLPAPLYELMTTPKAKHSGEPVPYGYGIMLDTVRGEPVIEHNGGIEGFAAQLTYFPAGGITVVVLSNTDAGVPYPRTLAHELGALALGRPYEVLMAVTPSAAVAASLVGTYRIDAAGTRSITLTGGRLIMRRGEGPAHPLAITRDGRLFFAGVTSDYFKIVRDAHGSVIALDYFAEGLPPAQRQARVNDARQ